MREWMVWYLLCTPSRGLNMVPVVSLESYLLGLSRALCRSECEEEPYYGQGIERLHVV